MKYVKFRIIKRIGKNIKPIILKRYFLKSLRDLLGAAEHILVEGNKKLILCERGISAPYTQRNIYRFILDVFTALKELVRYPIISDPSHASFWANYVP